MATAVQILFLSSVVVLAASGSDDALDASQSELFDAIMNRLKVDEAKEEQAAISGAVPLAW